MTTSPPAPTTLAERPRRLGVGVWDALVVAAGVVLVTSPGLRGQFHAHVRLTPTRWLSAPSAMATLALVALVVTLVGRRREILGLLGLAAVSLGLAAFWLLLGHHQWAGPVLVDLGDDHGIHLGDFLALVPVAAAGALVWTAAIRFRTTRRV
ncbi:MAG TPA: hypothetical protein PKY13_05945 [Microthrixaceae bacterium]|nr:hypothetical protein [Microthrixaceae bacterium]